MIYILYQWYQILILAFSIRVSLSQSVGSCFCFSFFSLTICTVEVMLIFSLIALLNSLSDLSFDNMYSPKMTFIEMWHEISH